MKNILILSVLSMSVIAGCASKPKVDTTPSSPTSVVKADVRNFGFKGMFATDGKEVTQTRSDMQNMNMKYKFSGTVMKYVGGKQDMSQITRLNDNLIWQLDNKEKRYRECSLENCFVLSSYKDTLFESDEMEEQPVCEVEFKSSDLTVNNTGNTRTINGFPVQEYKVSWVLVSADSEGREDRSEISSVVWTTTEASSEALALEEQYAKNYRVAVEGSALTGLYKAFPNEALSIMSKYLLSELPADIVARAKKAADKGALIKGYPISTKIEWNGKSEACPELQEAAEEKKEKEINTSSVSGFLSSIGDKVVDKVVEQKKQKELRRLELKPVFGYVREVKSIELEQVKDHKMTVPTKYKIDNRS